VPAEDTFAYMFLRSPPAAVLNTIWESGLSEGERRLVQDNLQRQGKGTTIQELIKQLAERVGDTAVIAAARLSEVYDKVEYREWYNDPKTDPDPQLGFAFLVPLRHAVVAKEVDDFIAERFVALGFRPEVGRETYKGISYGRLEIEQKSADFSQTSVSYMLAQNHLVIATNEGYLKKIIDTIQGGPSIGTEPTFQATMNLLGDAANVAVFVDLSKILRIAARVADGEGPRGYLWDKRNLEVMTRRDDREEAVRFRQELEQSFVKSRRVPTAVERAQMEEQVERHMHEWRARYPEFLEEYRRSLAEWGRLRSAGLSFAAGRETLSGRFAFLLTPSGTPAP
jgi:hypothetical protein